MKPEEKQQLEDLKRQVKEMQDYILGMSGKLEFRNTVAKFAKEAVIQQVAEVVRATPDAEIVNTITISIGPDGGSDTADVLAFPDKFVFLRDKDNNIYKVPAYIVTL